MLNGSARSRITATKPIWNHLLSTLTTRQIDYAFSTTSPTAITTKPILLVYAEETLCPTLAQPASTTP
uniref:Uncharacterized protein n=1 Tax=Cucumis sativus TaxID=3659 RepID=A0A0A0LUB8_CUCSA